MSQKPSTESNKRKLYVLVGVLVVASIAYRFISYEKLEQTSILFVGLPALVTLLMIKYSQVPKSAYGVVFRVITIFLMMSSILLGEGFVCVLFAAPIFYGVAFLVVVIHQHFNKKKESKLKSSVALSILIFVMAQPWQMNVESKLQSVETIVEVPREVSLENFNNSPDLMMILPSFFKVGFPKPLSVIGSGIDVGDRRDIQFRSSTKGIGTLSLEIIESSDDHIVFKAIDDNSHINHWLTWKQMKVEVVSFAPNETKIKWTSQYQCDLGPSWYFEPIEKFAVKIMNEHLVDAYFNR